jgi:AraC family transcriptional regulator, regulatory protein of adaptative response / methylphosphotriester-DNA alkyltransferase methyltransferase
MMVMASRHTTVSAQETDTTPSLAWGNLDCGYQRLCPELFWQLPKPPRRFAKCLSAELESVETNLCLVSVHLREVPKLAARGLLRALDDVLTPKIQQKYFTPLLDLCSYRGKLYGAPDDFSPYVLVSRREILKKHGFLPPKNWKELQQQAKILALKQKKPVVGVSTATPHQLVNFLLALLGSNGVPPPTQADDVITIKPQYTEVYDWVKLMIGNPRCLDLQTERAYGATDCFNLGNWIYRFCWLRDLKHESSNFFEQVHVQPIPRGPSGKAPLILGRGRAWIIPFNSRTEKRGIDALRHLTSLPSVIKGESRLGAPFHARKDVWKNSKVQKSHPIYHQTSALMPENYRYTTDYVSEFLAWLSRSMKVSLQRNESSQKWLAKIPRSIRKDYHQLVTQAISYMSKNIAKDFSMVEISKELASSRRHLDRLFQQEMNLSASDYLTNLRMEKATDLLKTTSLSVKEVANRTGFSDQSVFSRTFRRHWGFKPSEVRLKGSEVRAEASKQRP